MTADWTHTGVVLTRALPDGEITIEGPDARGLWIVVGADRSRGRSCRLLARTVADAVLVASAWAGLGTRS